MPERRAWVRFGCDLEAACRAKGRLKDAGWTAQVRDLSRGGLGLVLRHRFEAGLQLLLELRSRDRKICKLCPARVIRVLPVLVDGHAMWFLGCAFLEPLTDDDLRQLL